MTEKVNPVDAVIIKHKYFGYSCRVIAEYLTYSRSLTCDEQFALKKGLRSRCRLLKEEGREIFLSDAPEDILDSSSLRGLQIYNSERVADDLSDFWDDGRYSGRLESKRVKDEARFVCQRLESQYKIPVATQMKSCVQDLRKKGLLDAEKLDCRDIITHLNGCSVLVKERKYR